MALVTPKPRGISPGQLRQNPTAMIHDARPEAEYVLTDRGVPTARILPFRPHSWVEASSDLDGLG
jgi:antitoxin (DNA-binding transcriptional repressor) of toxin-antitoxin stability system